MPNFTILRVQTSEIRRHKHRKTQMGGVRIFVPIRVFLKIIILKIRFLHLIRIGIRYFVSNFYGPTVSNGWDYREQPILAQMGSVRVFVPIRVFVKIIILKFRFLHVTWNTNRYFVPNFHSPRVSNSWDYREQPILAQMGGPDLNNHNFENLIFPCHSG